MNAADAILLGLLAMGDLALVVFLRRARARRIRAERMMRCLRMAIQREIGQKEVRSNYWRIRRAG